MRTTRVAAGTWTCADATTRWADMVLGAGANDATATGANELPTAASTTIDAGDTRRAVLGSLVPEAAARSRVRLTRYGTATWGSVTSSATACLAVGADSSWDGDGAEAAARGSTRNAAAWGDGMQDGA